MNYLHHEWVLVMRIRLPWYQALEEFPSFQGTRAGIRRGTSTVQGVDLAGGRPALKSPKILVLTFGQFLRCWVSWSRVCRLNSFKLTTSCFAGCTPHLDILCGICASGVYELLATTNPGTQRKWDNIPNTLYQGAHFNARGPLIDFFFRFNFSIFLQPFWYQIGPLIRAIFQTV